MKLLDYVNASETLRALKVANEIQTRTANKLKPFDLNLTEALIIIAVFVEPSKRVRPSAIAEALQTSRGNISHGISKLCQSGFIARRERGADARTSEVTPTQKGSALAVRLMVAFNELEEYFVVRNQSGGDRINEC